MGARGLRNTQDKWPMETGVGILGRPSLSRCPHSVVPIFPSQPARPHPRQSQVTLQGLQELFLPTPQDPESGGSAPRTGEWLSCLWDWWELPVSGHPWAFSGPRPLVLKLRSPWVPTLKVFSQNSPRGPHPHPTPPRTLCDALTSPFPGRLLHRPSDDRLRSLKRSQWPWL